MLCGGRRLLPVTGDLLVPASLLSLGIPLQILPLVFAVNVNPAVISVQR